MCVHDPTIVLWVTLMVGLVLLLCVSDLQRPPIGSLERYLEKQDETLCDAVAKQHSEEAVVAHTNIVNEENMHHTIISVPDAMDAQGYAFDGIHGTIEIRESYGMVPQ